MYDYFAQTSVSAHFVKTTHYIATKEEVAEMGPQVQAAMKRGVAIVGTTFITASVHTGTLAAVNEHVLADPMT